MKLDPNINAPDLLRRIDQLRGDLRDAHLSGHTGELLDRSACLLSEAAAHLVALSQPEWTGVRG